MRFEYRPGLLFSHLSSPIELFSANFTDKYVENASYYGTYLTYIYPLADEGKLQGFVEVAEYSEEMKQQHMLSGSIFANRIERIVEGDKSRRIEHEVEEEGLIVLREFNSGDLHWKDYGDQIYVANQNGHYYEIKLQGKLNDEQLKQLLNHFVPDAKDKE